MGKILLVEPSRILRHAIGLFLSAENEVRVEEGTADFKTESLKSYDLLILDGPELRGRGLWSPELDQNIEESEVPILWMEEEGSAGKLKGERQAVLIKPIEKAALSAAVTSFLSLSKAEGESRLSGPVSNKTPSSGHGAAPESTTVQVAPQWIDLVDAVEEESSQTHQKKSPGKTE